MNILTVVYGILIILILAMFHELGHFFAAKLSGIGVEELSLGFGPTVYQKESGGTIYKIGALPILGYAKIKGMEGNFDAPDGYFKKGLWSRFFTVFAGPLMNFIVAILLFTFVFAAFGNPFTPTTIVNKVTKNSPAYYAGLKSGDKIIQIDGKAISNWQEITDTIHNANGKTLSIIVERGGKDYETNIIKIISEEQSGEKATVSRNVVDESKRKITIELQIGDPVMTVDSLQMEIDPGRGTSPILMKGWDMTIVPIRSIVETIGGKVDWFDKERMIVIQLKNKTIKIWVDNPIVEVNGEKIAIDSNNSNIKPIIINLRTFVPLRFVSDNLGCSIFGDVTLSVTPQKDKITGLWLIGIYPTNLRYSVAASFWEGIKWTGNTLYKMFTFIPMLFTKAGLSSIAGPIGIVAMTSQAAAGGFAELVWFTAFISIALGFTNLLPIPALDGSWIVLVLWEAITRKPVPPKKQTSVQGIGFIFLLGLMVLVSLRDIVRLIGK